jgi:hypothetical protein
VGLGGLYDPMWNFVKYAIANSSVSRKVGFLVGRWRRARRFHSGRESRRDQL